MKPLILSTIAMVPLFMWAQLGTHVQSSTPHPMIHPDQARIKQTLFQYRDALNASAVGQVLPLYTDTGVFMPAGAPSAVGQEQVKAAYEFVFSQIQLRIEFFIDEIEVAGEYAFARTTSRGQTLIHASGETVAEENRELFVLKRVDGNWKIDRYMFNKMSGPQK